MITEPTPRWNKGRGKPDSTPATVLKPSPRPMPSSPNCPHPNRGEWNRPVRRVRHPGSPPLHYPSTDSTCTAGLLRCPFPKVWMDASEACLTLPLRTPIQCESCPQLPEGSNAKSCDTTASGISLPNYLLRCTRTWALTLHCNLSVERDSINAAPIQKTVLD